MLSPITHKDVEKINKKFTKLEFRNLFTFEELIVIEEAASTDAGVRILKENQALAEFIDLTDRNTINGINYLVSKNLLTEERANQILNQ
jgi:hypothetical protein